MRQLLGEAGQLRGCALGRNGSLEIADAMDLSKAR